MSLRHFDSTNEKKILNLGFIIHTNFNPCCSDMMFDSLLTVDYAHVIGYFLYAYT